MSAYAYAYALEETSLKSFENSFRFSFIILIFKPEYGLQ